MVNVSPLVKTLHPYEITLLNSLEKESTLSEITQKSSLEEIQAKRAIEWLSNKQLITYELLQTQVVSLGSNGILYKEKGLPETRFLRALDTTATPVSVLSKKAAISESEINIVIGTLKRKGAVSITKEKELLVALTSVGEVLLKKPSPEEVFLQKDFPLPFDTITDLDKLAFDSLKNRKDILLIEDCKDIAITITSKGNTIKKELVHVDLSKITDVLDSTQLKTGSWKDKTFRHYDVEAKVPSIYGGKKHFANQAIEYMKQIWVELGFEEMSGNLCQTGFWDLDVLFVPQDHPARAMQDSFFIKSFDGKGILKGTLPPLSKIVAKVHENGHNTGSKGWGGTFSFDFSSEVMLRTHTTVVSAKYLASRLKKDDKGNILPSKFFSVNKVFRNETPDWKHLFEFNQIEGIVVDPNANFQHLLGYLKVFFKKMGFPDVRIRPGHFPYTEPSAEFDVYNPRKKQWVELGGSGIFRPEVTKTIIGEEIPVLAWGLGMERIILEYFDLKDIRDIYRNDSKQLKEMKSFMEVSK